MQFGSLCPVLLNAPACKYCFSRQKDHHFYYDTGYRYGGGIFINASQVTVVGVFAMKNIAQQGSGVFAVSSSSSFESCTFQNNTAVTASSKSKFNYAPSSFSHGFLEKIPDPEAALGAGLFVSDLWLLKNCTFTDNLAIAGISQGSGWNPVTNVVSGAHALGSGVFAVRILNDARLYQNEWIRSKQLCGGPCVAGGSFFIGVIGNSVIFERMTFESCETISIADSLMDQSCNTHSRCLGISPALGFGISFVSAPSVKFTSILSSKSLVQSVGLSVGGILTAIGSLSNASISNTAVYHAVSKCFGVTCKLRGAVFYLNKALLTTISTVLVSFLRLSCLGSSCKIFGGAVDIIESNGMGITDMNMSYISAHASGNNAFIRGSSLNVGSITASNLSNFAVNDMNISCDGLSCIIGGGVLNIDICKDTSFLSLNFGNISAACSGSACLVYGSHLFLVDALRVFVVKFISQDASIVAEKQMFGGVLVVQNSVDLYLSNVSLQNIGTKCGQFACDMRGSLLHFDTSTRLFLSKVFVYGSSSKLSVSGCIHNGPVTCYIVFFFFRVASETSIHDIQVFDSNMACIGDHCTASGILNLQTCQYCNVTMLNVSNMSCSSMGRNSRSYGCVVFLVRAAFSHISNISVKNASVSVFGSFIGGGIIGSESFFGSSLTNVAFEHVFVVCSNPKCASQIGSSVPIECICRVSGGLIWFAKANASIVHNISSISLMSQCFGDFCSVLGAALQIDALLQSRVSNVTISSAQADAVGYSSSASGAGMFITLSERSSVQFFMVSSSSCTSVGVFSTAMGVGLAILAGNIQISDLQLVNLLVSCSGSQCYSLGGGISVVSSLSKTARNPDYKDLSASSNINGSRVFCQSLHASCFGASCTASGAGISVKRSFRSTDTLGLVKAELTNEIPDVVRIQLSHSQFSNCSLFSEFINSSLTGGTLSFEPAVVTISASFIHDGKIQSSNLSAFFAGGAIFVSGSESTVELNNSQLMNNSVPSLGLGGALYLGSGSFARVIGSAVSNNSASRGAGIYVEASFLELHQSSVNWNRAADRGAAIFCASIDRRCSSTNTGCVGGSSSISVASSNITDNVAAIDDAVGSSMFVAGAVSLNIDKSTSILVKSGSAQPAGAKRDQTGVYLSAYAGKVSQPSTMCQDGTMLRVTPVTSSSLAVTTNEPLAEVLSGTSCFPLCIGVPQYNSFVVSQGMVASCSPCPQDTYSFKTSNSTLDSEDQFCIR